MNDLPDFAKAVLKRLFPEMVSYLPLLPLLADVQNATTPTARATAVIKLLRFGATKTPISLDDELLDLLEPAMRTPEGSALVNWIANRLVEGIFKMEGPQP